VDVSTAVGVGDARCEVGGTVGSGEEGVGEDAGLSSGDSVTTGPAVAMALALSAVFAVGSGAIEVGAGVGSTSSGSDPSGLQSTSNETADTATMSATAPNPASQRPGCELPLT
jgi:hypothetical protein